jgi:hypothetical protein
VKLGLQQNVVLIVGNAFLAGMVLWTGTPMLGRNGTIVAIVFSGLIYNGALYAGTRVHDSRRADRLTDGSNPPWEKEASLRLWRQISIAVAALGVVFFIVIAGLPMALVAGRLERRGR